MKTLWIGTALAVLFLGCQTALAATETVAVIPVHAVRGAVGNGALLTDAVIETLKKRGFEVSSAERVKEAVRVTGINLAQPQFLPAIQKLQMELDVDHVVYIRILTVGYGDGMDEFQANILANVASRGKKQVSYARQVGYVWPRDRRVVVEMTEREATKAAVRLFEGFRRD